MKSIRLKKFFQLFILTWALLIYTPLIHAQMYDDSPRADEIFSSFFARITHGGFFNGIRLQAPDRLQKSFLKRIKKSSWVGARSLVHKSLEAQGVNLWGDWFRSALTRDIIFPTLSAKQIMSAAIQTVLNEDQSQCAPNCPQAEAILSKAWDQQDVFSHQVFVKAYVFKAALFNGKTIAELLAQKYQIQASLALATTQIRLLSTSDFKNAVHELGYGGEVYFRGLTTIDPKLADHHIILLDDEALAKGSPFDYPLFKNLEVPAILTHELSHVMQDLRGNSLGLDVQVTSAETALVIEGMAEYLAETVLRQAGDSLNYPSALSLFVTEQAVEMVYRPGNESSGNLFPYTVGLPFVASLYDLSEENKKLELTDRLLRILGGKESLQAFVNTF